MCLIPPSPCLQKVLPILQPGSAAGYGVPQNQYGNTGTLQYTPQLRDQNAHAEMLRAMALRQGAQGLESSYRLGVTPRQQYWGQNPSQPPPGSMGLGRLGGMIHWGRMERRMVVESTIRERLLYNFAFFSFSCKIERILRFANDEESEGKEVWCSDNNKRLQVYI